MRRFEITCPECRVFQSELNEIAKSVAGLLGVYSIKNAVYGDDLTEDAILRVLDRVASEHALTAGDFVITEA